MKINPKRVEHWVYLVSVPVCGYLERINSNTDTAMSCPLTPFPLCAPLYHMLMHTRTKIWSGLDGIVGYLLGSRCYVRLDFLRQFKSDWLWRLEGLIFEKKFSFYWT
jgi:hypothetical protein